MTLSRCIVGAAAAAFIAATVPSVARAQSGRKTACNDGTNTMSTGAKACDGHGGIHKVHTMINHRAPSNTSRPGVTQAGTPDPRPAAKPNYEERRGWRWGRRHEAEKHEAKREERREEERRRVRCHDGKYETVAGKGHDVCRHHGGVAH